jgi:hypothetical protein
MSYLAYNGTKLSARYFKERLKRVVYIGSLPSWAVTTEAVTVVIIKGKISS